VVAAAAVSGALAGGVGATVLAAILGLIGWAAGAFVLLLVGTKLLPGRNTQADFGQVLRTAGFAQAIGLFGILGAIPLLGYLIRVVIWIWVLVAMIVAVRQALDYEDTGRAVLVCVIAWVIMFVVSFIAVMAGFSTVEMGAL
jgi:hypothetical protein